MIIRTTRLLALVAAAALSMPALATTTTPPSGCSHKGKPCKPTPTKPNPTPSSSSGASAGSSSSSAALAGAAAVSSVGNVGGGAASVDGVSSSSAGGTSDLQSDIDVSAAPTITDSSSSRAWSLFLPPPAWTPPMAPVQCPSANIEQGSTSLLWSGFSNATARTDSSDCTLIQVRNAKVEACQYASAKQIEDLIVSKYLKDYQPSTVGMVDYTDKECAALKTAALPKPQPVIYPLAPLADKPADPPKPEPVKPEPVKPAAKTPPAKPKAVAAKPACADGKVLACTVPATK